MSVMPVIVGFGGYSAAGRSSFHHAYKRIVFDSLNKSEKERVCRGLAAIMQTTDDVNQEAILSNTLVRKLSGIENSSGVEVAAQLPLGFDPGRYYRSNFHPRGLQMTILAVSDALHSVGVPWSDIMTHVPPDKVGTFSGSLMGQLDEPGYGGMMQSKLMGGRVSAKNLALGFSSMPADFINAYVLGSVGQTSAISGACATFLYNLKYATEAIKNGDIHVAIVGNSEAPITTEVIEGYAAMGALATTNSVRKIVGNSLPYQHTSQPFGDNFGFVLAESAQYFVLMSDQLAIKLGARIYGAVEGVWLNADGVKKSISAPGVGNYLTLGKAYAHILRHYGESALQESTFVMAHGSGTPQNRLTESRILSKLSASFSIDQMPISAIKAHIGHSLGPASADQLFCVLGAFENGVLPGLGHVRSLAENVKTRGLNITLDHLPLSSDARDFAVINSKGFGGNNASAVIANAELIEKKLRLRLGKGDWTGYLSLREKTIAKQEEYADLAMAGSINPIYLYGEPMIDEEQLEITPEKITIPGYALGIDLL